VRIKFLRLPPLPEVPTPWRDLYSAGRFAQRDLTWASNFNTWARERGLFFGPGTATLERLDVADVFQPIVFSLGGYFGDAKYDPKAVDHLVFREEQLAQPWSAHAWDADGFATTTALYSPWQLLYINEALDGGEADFGLDTLLAHEPERSKQIDSLRVLLEGQRDAWRRLDEGWSPLVKLLVRLQNYYWPRVSGTVTLAPGAGSGYETAGPESGDDDKIDPAAAMSGLGLSRDEVLDTYHFLVERGLDLDPRDGFTTLRRARQRGFHARWRGRARRAQDYFDAAQILRLALTDLDGSPPAAPQLLPMDGRQLERAELYRLGPAPRPTVSGVKRRLADLDLFSAGVLVIGEGPSEQIAVDGLVSEIVGPSALNELRHHDLGGSGGAVRIRGLLETFGDAVLASFLVVDREGRMGEYVQAAIKSGAVPADDVMLWNDSLEAANASPRELIGLVAQIGRAPVEAEGAPAREPAELHLTVEDLEKYHHDRCERAHKNDMPGLADSLLTLARREEHGNVVVEKLDLAQALTDMLVAELRSTQKQRLDDLKVRRPLVGFVIDRIAPQLVRAVD
jgi:hypothetical protein